MSCSDAAGLAVHITRVAGAEAGLLGRESVCCGWCLDDGSILSGGKSDEGIDKGGGCELHVGIMVRS